MFIFLIQWNLDIIFATRNLFELLIAETIYSGPQKHEPSGLLC